VSQRAEPPEPGAGGRRILEGRLHAFFAFDVANAIELEAIPSVLRPGRASLRRRRPAPEYVEYAVAPVDIALGERELGPHGGGARVAASARLFDFGAVSVCLTLPLPETLEALPAFAQALPQEELASEARRVVEELVREIRPALRGLGLNELVEDYFVFHLGALDRPIDAEAFLREEAALLAATLCLDAGRLSRQQIEEALRDPVSYSPGDLLVADWGAAIVCDTDAADALAVLEFLNVQLVELRFLDSRLDRALARFSEEVYQNETLWRAIRGPHRVAIRALSELTVEAESLSERVENAVKLVPDVYLARVHRRSAGRLGLPTWSRMVSSKLEALRHLTTVLRESAAARRAEALEITIILLIALEIALALLGRLGN
jgi:hypothetical protein